MLIDFLHLSDPRWREALNNLPHDIYDLPEYVALCARSEGAQKTGSEGAEAAAFYAVDGNRFCLIPLLLRSLPSSLENRDGWRDAISPYGYSGALFRGPGDWARTIAQSFASTCAAHRIVSALIRLHPLLPVPAPALEAAGIHVIHGETVPVDLTTEPQLRTDHRAGIRRLRREGFSVTDDWSLYPHFIEIYGETMHRLGAGDYYHFPAPYFHDLKAALGPQLHLYSVLAPSGEVAAAGLFTERNGLVQYHLSGTADPYRKQAPSKLMLEEAILRGRAAGDHTLHLGGGLGASQDSLFLFKAGFSPLRARFATWRFICEPDRYAALTRAAEAPATDYFPAYRKAA